MKKTLLTILLAIALCGTASAAKKTKTPQTTTTTTTTATTTTSIVGALGNLSQSLVVTVSGKPTFAYVALSSDDGNALVEDYVTDALTEAMFKTGKIKIVERASIEKIINEQQFQTSALVNENTVAEIGKLSGADYVCYGTVKDLGDQLMINVKVVEVKTAELCSMGRDTVDKDKYLKNVGFEKRKNSGGIVTAGGNKTTTTSSSITSSATASKSNLKSAWEVKRKENGSYTSYLFITKGAGDQFLFVGYDKYDSIGGSCVRSGIYWVPKAVDVGGSYEVKVDDGTKVTKNFSWGWWSYNEGWGHQWSKFGQGYFPFGLNSSGREAEFKGRNNDVSSTYENPKDEVSKRFAFTYNAGESARFWVDRIDKNDFIAVKHNNENVRFQTASFWQTVEEQGLSRDEIMNVIANDEF